MSILKYLFFTLTSTIVLWNCASMQTPSGGEKDILPPQILHSVPAQSAVNVMPKTIEIHFDEFFVLNNLQNELLISPPLNETPVITQKGKSLFIELKEELNHNSTYTFNFGKGIADYNEGNVLKDYSLVFSTGNELDSLSIKGSVNSCPENKLPENVIIGIYEKDTLHRDSTIFLQKPDYFGLANEVGEFQINHIRKGIFELIAFEDVNANYQYDGATEQIAFSDSLIVIGDSTHVNLWLFKEVSELKLLESKISSNGRAHWVYNNKVDTAQIHSNSTSQYTYSIKKDSLFAWPLKHPTDSFYVWAEVGMRTDSILVVPDTLQNRQINLSIDNNFLKDDQQLTIHSDEPILAIDTSLIKLISDSTHIAYTLSHTNFEFFLNFPHEGNKNYDVIINRGAILSRLNNSNDSTKVSLFSKAENALASLKINLTKVQNPFFMELIKDGTVVDKIEYGDELIFTDLLPSTYQLRLTIDHNQDGKWTAGNYLESNQAEKVYYYPEELNLMANWELEIDF